jgi:hypothetical protein
MTKKTRNSGQWTEARFQSFIKSALRKASMRWGPVNQTKKAAWVERGKYLCEGYERGSHVVPLTLDKKKNVFVDHISPIVLPEEGFVSWDTYIERMFCEAENLQVLCKECHDRKSKDEREARK